MTNNDLGAKGETLAAAYLEERGYVILDRNYRFERSELDLVCFHPAERYEEGGQIVFTEVKTRRGVGFGRPEEAVTEEKKRSMKRAAEAYLHERRLEGSPVRFDVVSILLRDGAEPEVEHFENAFWWF